MPSRGHRKSWPVVGDPGDPGGFEALLLKFRGWMEVKGYAEATVAQWERQLRLFACWCSERGVVRPSEVTRGVLERYQRAVYAGRRLDNGQALSLKTQRGRLTPLKVFFRWLVRGNVVLFNPASELELPRVEQRLVRGVLTEEEAERLLAGADVGEALGLRDRAMLETLYATGIRRSELAALKIYDVDLADQTVFVRQGKGRKDRLLPLGERAAAWIERYASEARPQLVCREDDGWLYLTRFGGRFNPHSLNRLVKGYVIAAGIQKAGACHLLRHTMATLMLEHGADLRYIQEMLGHADLSTTQVYTRVSMRKLKEVHAETHPGAKLKKPGSLASGLIADEAAAKGKAPEAPQEPGLEPEAPPAQVRITFGYVKAQPEKQPDQGKVR